tara:strand:- start:317 stop:550 length:234 start_codon:yes stop_codon:yes gene_type:complete
MLMVDYSANTATRALMANNNNQFGHDFIRLAVAKLVTAARTEYRQCFAETKIKFFTGGGVVTAKPSRAGAWQKRCFA